MILWTLNTKMKENEISLVLVIVSLVKYFYYYLPDELLKMLNHSVFLLQYLY